MLECGLQRPACRTNLLARCLNRKAPLHEIFTDAAHTGYSKWSGIAALGSKLFAAPSEAPVLLVVETLAGSVRGNSTNKVHTGDSKWSGISALGSKLFAAPYSSPVLLVVATMAGPVRGNSTNEVHTGNA